MATYKNGTLRVNRVQLQSPGPNHLSYQVFEESLDTAIATYSRAMQKPTSGRKRVARVHTIGSQLKQKLQKLPDGSIVFSLAELFEGVRSVSGLEGLADRQISDEIRRLINGIRYREKTDQAIVERKFYVTYVKLNEQQYGVVQITQPVA